MTGITAHKEPFLDVERAATTKSTDDCIQPVTDSPKRATSILGVLSVPWVKSILTIGLCFDVARMSLIVLVPFYVNAETHDPFLVELSGAAGSIFLLLGPCLGLLSDRWDRKSIMVCYFGVAGLVTGIVALVLLSGTANWQLVFMLMLVVSLCNVMDTTTRMPLASDLLTASHQSNLLGSLVAIRSAGYRLMSIVGCQLVGFIVQFCGFKWAFLWVATQFIAGLLLSLQLPRFAKVGARSGEEDASCQKLCSRSFVSIIGVTVLANFFYWSCQPLILVLGTRLGAPPWKIGVLTSAPFCGALGVAVALAKWNPHSTGFLYCTGIILASAAIACTGAVASSYAAVLVGLACAGSFASLFGTVQAAVIIGMAPPDLRGRAMGFLTLAIGAAPFGMATLGKLAARCGADVALTYFGVSGVICLILWLLCFPSGLFLRRLS